MSRPPTRMKALAKLVLREGYIILSNPKAISNQLNISKGAACSLKRGYLKRTKTGFLCPEDLTRMVCVDNKEYICERCGFVYSAPMISLPDSSYNNIQKFGLGTYQKRFGELKGLERFYQACLRETRSVLERYSLNDKVLIYADNFLKNMCELYFEGKTTSLAIYRVAALTLVELTKYSNQLRLAPYEYLSDPTRPHQSCKNSYRTKSTKLYYYRGVYIVE